MIWMRGIETKKGQQNDVLRVPQIISILMPPRIPLAYHHLYMMQQAVYQYGTFQQYG